MQDTEVIKIIMNKDYDNPKHENRRKDSKLKASITMDELNNDVYYCECGNVSVIIDNYNRKYCRKCFSNKFKSPIGQKKPERNSPCPCGSGKKYKKCCY